MRRGARQLLRLHTGRGLIALFAVTMFLPGILLAVLGVRAFHQERRLADPQIRERLELAMDSLSDLRVHPDGRHRAFTSAADKNEVWAMENFLPLAK
jgi:hypothetical protein